MRIHETTMRFRGLDLREELRTMLDSRRIIVERNLAHPETSQETKRLLLVRQARVRALMQALNESVIQEVEVT